MIANGFAGHTHGVWTIDGNPLLVTAIPIIRVRGRGVLVIARPLDAKTAKLLADSAQATVTIVGDGWQVSSAPAAPAIDVARARTLAADGCQPTENVAAHPFASAFVVIGDAR